MSQTLPQTSYAVIEEISDDGDKPIETKSLTATSMISDCPPSTSKNVTSVDVTKRDTQCSSTSQSNLYKLEFSDSSFSSAVEMIDGYNVDNALPSNNPSARFGTLTPEIEQLNGDDDNDLTPANRTNPQFSGIVSNRNSIDYLITLSPPAEASELPLEDPIIIRGNGTMTLFGLSNSFSNSFPSALLGRVSREEFEYTISRINGLLQQQHSTNAKFLLLGCLCCCCSLGCSLLWPTFALSKRTRHSLEKLLSMENSRLYNKLGLNWRLSKQQCHTNQSFMEYILIVDFLPKMHIYQPD